jgi:hypothetical protein
LRSGGKVLLNWIDACTSLLLNIRTASVPFL